MSLLAYQPTPVQPLLSIGDVSISIKREDLNHSFVSGNKWWKLKYNLEEALKMGHDTVLTFGGAFSNHIYSTAAAAKELGLKSIGIIRGEESRTLSHTLQFAQSCGMHLHFVSREEYRKKMEEDFRRSLRGQFGSFYLIPEGGTNSLAIKGCSEWAKQLQAEIDFDYVCLAVGTGGTMAGLIEGIDQRKTVIGFSALKGGSFLEEEIRKYTSRDNWEIQVDYHFGGYAKTTPELLNFIIDAEKKYQVPLDQVYTAKMLFGVLDLAKKNFFKSGSKVLVLHTGGLQGRTHFQLDYG